MRTPKVAERGSMWRGRDTGEVREVKQTNEVPGRAVECQEHRRSGGSEWYTVVLFSILLFVFVLLLCPRLMRRVLRLGIVSPALTSFDYQRF